MISTEDLSSVYQFLKSTSETNLKHMLVDKNMTELHLRMMLKIVRMCTEGQFIDYAQKGTFPRMKFSAPEIAIREDFWAKCFTTFQTNGLIGATQAQAA